MVSLEYHEFFNIFFQTKSDKILSHRPYNHYIELKKGTKSPYKLLYRMSHEENKELHKYLFENLDKKFIRVSQSPIASSVLFV